MMPRIFGKDFENRFFYICFFIYIIIHVGVAAELHLKREIPWEPDDHYHYISKASNLLNCLVEKCSALDDIYAQTKPISVENPSLNVYVNSMRNREKHRILLAYHPLYSALLVGLRISGLTFENGQVLVDVLGTIVLGIGFGLFSNRLFGRGPAALSLLALSVLLLPGWGTHLVNSWHFANGFILLSWWAIAHRKKINFKFVTLCSTLAVLSHPIGIILFGASVVPIALQRRNWTKNCALYLFFMGAFMAFYYIAMARLGGQNAQITNTYMSEHGLLEILRINFYGIYTYLKVLALNASPLFSAICFCVIASTVSKRIRELIYGIALKWWTGLGEFKSRAIVIYSLTVLGIVLISLVEPHTVGFFPRIGPLVVIFLLGLFFSFTWFVARIIWDQAICSGDDGHSSQRVISNVRFRIGNARLQKSYIALILVSLFVTVTYNGVRLCYGTAEKVLGHNMVFLPETVDKVLNDSNTDNRILYNLNSIYNSGQSWSTYNREKIIPKNKINTGAEAGVSFFLSYGGLKRGAVLSNLVLSTPDEKKWIDESISHMITLSPSTVALGGDIVLHGGDSLTVEKKNAAGFDEISVYVQNEEGPVLLIVEGVEKFRIEIASNSEQWVEIPSHILSGSGKIRISTQPINSYVNRLKDIFSFSRSVMIQTMSYRTRIGGLRIGDQATYWPWNQPIKIIVSTFYSKRIDREIVYETKTLTPVGRCQVGEVISDKGSIVATRISCSKS